MLPHCQRSLTSSSLTLLTHLMALQQTQLLTQSGKSCCIHSQIYQLQCNQALLPAKQAAGVTQGRRSANASSLVLAPGRCFLTSIPKLDSGYPSLI